MEDPIPPPSLFGEACSHLEARVPPTGVAGPLRRVI